MDDTQSVKLLHEKADQLRGELSRVIVGQEATIDLLLISLFAGGHSLLVGVPGLAKTLLVRTLGEVLGLSFSRIQFTPDLMPSDITGTEVIQEDRTTGDRVFRFVEGPVFANLVLADEINRTPPKTQAALLEAMQEKQVTAAGNRHPLPSPFFVMATQNPIEQEGTYPLPEAQMDRFMFQITIDYPEVEDELSVILNTTSDQVSVPNRVVTTEELQGLLTIVRKIPVAEHVARYALELVRRTRPGEEKSPEVTRKYLTWGAGTRGGQNLILGAKARAALSGRFAATEDDVRSVAIPVLSHRIQTNFTADAENVTANEILQQILEDVANDSRFKTNGQLPDLLGSKNA